MFTMHRGISSVAVALLVTFGLLGGAGAGYAFREPIKKAVSGKTTSDEINEAVTDAKNEQAQGQNKFELEGIATSVDEANKMITVKIKSSTDSIKELRLSETPIIVSDSAKIQFGDQKDLKITNIPIDSQVHVGGTIADGKLTAEKIIVQKENGLEKEGANFSIGGTVKAVGTSDLTVTVKTANSKAKDKKGTDLKIMVNTTTIIEKGDAVIALSDVKAGDEVHITGIIESSNFTASKIEVKVSEEGGELDDTDTGNKSSSPSPATSSSPSPNSNSNRGGNSDDGND